MFVVCKRDKHLVLAQSYPLEAHFLFALGEQDAEAQLEVFCCELYTRVRPTVKKQFLCFEFVVKLVD